LANKPVHRVDHTPVANTADAGFTADGEKARSLGNGRLNGFGTLFRLFVALFSVVVIFIVVFLFTATTKRCSRHRFLVRRVHAGTAVSRVAVLCGSRFPFLLLLCTVA
jgi:hypothetical protein